MDFAVYPGALEIRQRGGARLLSGRFSYGRRATISDRGRVRKESIGPDAFAFQLNRFAELQEELGRVMQGTVDQVRRELLEEQLERANVHVLAGHDFNRPLGDMKRGTARVTSNREALNFEVDLPDDGDLPTYFEDLLKEVRTNRAGVCLPAFAFRLGRGSRRGADRAGAGESRRFHSAHSAGGALRGEHRFASGVRLDGGGASR